MHGNIWEWCEDTWHYNYSKAPTDGSAWMEGNLDSHVLRGGSWGDLPGNCRSAGRFRLDANYGVGFRVVYAPARTF